MDKNVTSSNGNIFTGHSVLNNLSSENDSYCALSMSALLASGEVPASHKRIADNYMIIKKIYGFNTLQSGISNVDKNRLLKYDFSPLEFSTMKQINEEIEYLKKWSTSMDPILRSEADEILNIRVKELKYLNANKYAMLSNEFYNGFMALEKYFETISKY